MNSRTTLEEAQALVERWSEDMGHPWLSIGIMGITLTDLVKERLATDIVAMVVSALAQERCQHPSTIRFRQSDRLG